jgi:thiol-disulfide isomerase/thioredoxin
MLRRLALALTLAATPLALPQALPAQDLGIPIGTKAPAVALQTLDGKPASLGQYIGKGPVLIEFWASWCPNCKALEPKLHAAAKKYAGRVKFVAVAVSVNQSVERVRRYQAQHKLPMELLYDRTGDASEAYEAPATSYVVVLDKTGKVVYTGAGGDQDLDAAIRKAL